MKQYNDDDVFESNKELYRIPYHGEVIIFSPSSSAVMKANPNVVKMIDICSFPTTYKHINYLFDATGSETVSQVASILTRLYISGYLSLNGNYHVIDIDNKTTNTSVTRKAAPLSASIHLTDRCTLNCAYCYNAKSRKTQRTELDTDEWKAVFNDLASSGVKRFTATGGEPFLRFDLFNLFQELRDEGIHTDVITNGTLLSRENIDQVRKSFEHIIISLDSHIQEINDLNRGNGSYDRTMRSIHLLEKIGISYTINSVLTKHNILEFIEMKEYFREYKYCKEIKPIVYERTSLNDSLCPSYSQVDRYLFELYEYLLSECDFASVASDPKRGMMVRRQGCGTGLTECAIGPDGSIYPCRALYDEHFNAGNILEEDFMFIWENSSVLKEIRYADMNRPSLCRDKQCDLFHYCLGGCFGHTFASIGELVPWASNFDCYRIKQQTRQKLIAMVMSAEEGTSVLRTI